jgi:O-antigen/teichoic acid export membrane protein
LTLLVALISPAVLFGSVSAVQIGTLNGFEAFAANGRLLALEGLLTGALLVCGALVDGVRGAVLGIIIATAGAYFLRRHAIASICRDEGIAIRRRGRIVAEIPLLRSLVLPSALFGLGAQPFAWLARALLARGTHGLAEVGVFSAAYSWGAAVLTVPMQVTRPAMPILTNLLAHGDRASFKRLLRDTLLLALGTALLVALPMMALAPWIMRAYGARFAAGTLVLCAVAASSILAALTAALRSALVATGEVWGQVLQSLLWGCTLIGTFYATRAHGAMALGIAYVVAFAVTLAGQVWMTMTALKTERRTRSAVDLSEPVIAEVSALETDPEA